MSSFNWLITSGFLALSFILYGQGENRADRIDLTDGTVLWGTINDYAFGKTITFIDEDGNQREFQHEQVKRIRMDVLHKKQLIMPTEKWLWFQPSVGLNIRPRQSESNGNATFFAEIASGYQRNRWLGGVLTIRRASVQMENNLRATQLMAGYQAILRSTSPSFYAQLNGGYGFIDKGKPPQELSGIKNGLAGSTLLGMRVKNKNRIAWSFEFGYFVQGTSYTRRTFQGDVFNTRIRAQRAMLKIGFTFW